MTSTIQDFQNTTIADQALHMDLFDTQANRSGTVPFLSTITGTHRFCKGLFELISGIFTMMQPGQVKWGAIKVVNGLGNVVRGAVEFVPIIGNILSSLANQASGGYSSLINRNIVNYTSI